MIPVLLLMLAARPIGTACIPQIGGTAVCRVGPEGTGTIILIPRAELRAAAIDHLAAIQLERKKWKKLQRPLPDKPPPATLAAPVLQAHEGGCQ